MHRGSVDDSMSGTTAIVARIKVGTTKHRRPRYPIIQRIVNPPFLDTLNGIL